MNIRYKASKALGFIKRYKTIGLTAAAVVGVPATAYFAVKANDKYKETKKKKEFILPAAIGTATAACIVLAEKIHISRENALILSYNVLAERFTDYKTAAAKLLGAAGTAKIVDGAANLRERREIEEPRSIDNDGETLHWFYDCFSETWFRDTWYHVFLANLALQEQYSSEGFGLVKYYYGEIDLPFNGSDALGFDCERLQCDFDCMVGVPFEYPEMKRPDGEIGFAIEWPIEPKVIDWLLDE